MSTEVELLRAAQAGDRSAVESLLQDHEKQIYRFGLRMCGNEDAAREVLQETLLAAFKGISQFRADAQLSTWLFQVARSFCHKQRRRRDGQPAVFEDSGSPETAAVEDPARTPDQVAEAREIGAMMQAAILQLPREQREVLVLRDVEGLSAEETAAVLGLEIPALKSRLHRARALLRDRLSAVLTPAASPGSTCGELAKELLRDVETDIDQSACARIEAHLAACPECAASYGGLQRAVSLCKALPGGDVPSAVKTAVREALAKSSALR